MNFLNNVIVEGLFHSGKAQNHNFYFKVHNTRYHTMDTGISTEENNFKVVVKTEQLIENCSKIENGAFIRVVGRLSNLSETDNCIIAEHVELKGV